MKRIGMMATYPARYQSLLEMLPSIAPQLDRLYLYCNEYDQDNLIGLNNWITNEGFNCKVVLIDPDYTEGNVKDMGKFWALGVAAGYVFLLDDDLLYPDDYTSKHITAIEKHQSISTVHGRVIKNFPIENYFGDTLSLNYRHSLGDYQRVDIAGTGTTAFKTTYMPNIFADENSMKKFSGVADIWFACQANVYEQEIYCLPRPDGWLLDTQNSCMEESLYAEAKDDTYFHCLTLNQLTWDHD